MPLIKKESTKVYLLGAGPGDVRLLTCRAKEVLEKADVVVFDRLLSAATLALIPQKAKQIDVGKVAGNHKVKQDEISQILVDEASSAAPGSKIVRLKGGDPFVFGRGGEEIDKLIKAGIDFEVVPGLSSAIAAPSYAGIPVTHRDCCSSFQVITAHKRGDIDSDEIDYGAVANAGGTMIFLMGVSAVAVIRKGLTDAGMDPNMPVAMIESGTLAGQRRIVTTLSNMEAAAESSKLKSPAIVLVGKVAALAEDFDWRSKLPLFGARVIVTRSRSQAGKLSAMLRDQGAEVLEAPALELEMLDPNEAGIALEKISEYKYCAFTSPNGVDALIEYLRKHKIDMRSLYGSKIAAIGSGTSEALERYALYPDIVPDVYDAGHLGEAIAAKCQKGDKVLTFRAEIASDDLPAALEKSGVELDDIAIYRANMGVRHSWLVRSWVEENEPVIVALASARSALAFADCVQGLDMSNVYAACIGKQTAEAAKNAGIKNIGIAERATLDELLECTAEIYASL